MKTRRTMNRWALARRLQALALRIAAGRSVRVGKGAVRIPDRFLVEEELETKDGETELELELRWPAAPTRKPGPGRAKRSR